MTGNQKTPTGEDFTTSGIYYGRPPVGKYMRDPQKDLNGVSDTQRPKCQDANMPIKEGCGLSLSTPAQSRKNSI